MRAIRHGLKRLWAILGNIHLAAWLWGLGGASLATTALAYYQRIKADFDWIVLGGCFAGSFSLIIVSFVVNKRSCNVGDDGRTPAAGSAPLAETEKLDAITFEYLPDTPLKHGWKLSEAGEMPEYWASSQINNGLSLKAKERYALDFEVKPCASLCDLLKFTADYSHDAVMYAKIQVASKDDSISKPVWLAYSVGKGLPKKSGPNEWTIYVSATRNGQLVVDSRLPVDVEHTYGREGLKYRSLLAIRLRGSLSISPIELYRVES